MKKRKRRHKQSKFFTIMMVPDSSAKVRRMRIPYWVLSVFALPFLCMLAIVLLFQTRVESLESSLDYSAARLSESFDEKGRLRESLSTAESSHATSRMEHESTISQLGDYEQQMAYFERVIAENEQILSEMLVRIEAIDDMKHGIINVFNDIAALDIPFQFDGNSLSGGVIRAMGGAYAGQPEDVLLELEAMISNETQSFQALTRIAEELESYFRARPAGWPVSGGRVGSEFGFRMNVFSGRGLERHNGIDIAVPTGTNVYATAYGVVSFAGWNNGGYGFLVIIEHEYDYITYYAHNSRVLVSAGDEVSRGQVIALSGNSGRSLTPHVHYEVRVDNLPRNPRGFLS
jgi:septal ring factor EnvC (AmiA/AmiB activator)